MLNSDMLAGARGENPRAKAAYLDTEQHGVKMSHGHEYSQTCCGLFSGDFA